MEHMMPKTEIGAWFKFYPQDWLASATASGLSLAERGAYMTLLCVAWEHGGIPADTKRLAVMLGVSRQEFEELWGGLHAKWREHPDDPKRLVNPRQEDVRASQQRLYDARSEAGRLGGKAKRKQTSKQTQSKQASYDQEDSGLRTQDSGDQDTRDARARDDGDRIGNHTGAADLASWCTTDALDSRAFFELERHFVTLGREAEDKGIPLDRAYRSMRVAAEECLESAKKVDPDKMWGKWKRMLLGTGKTDLAGRFRAAMKHHNPEATA